MTPWSVAFLGALCGALGAFVTFMGIDSSTAVLVIAGGILGTLGSLALLVGLIGMGVKLGVEASAGRLRD